MTQTQILQSRVDLQDKIYIFGMIFHQYTLLYRLHYQERLLRYVIHRTNASYIWSKRTHQGKFPNQNPSMTLKIHRVTKKPSQGRWSGSAGKFQNGRAQNSAAQKLL